MTSRGITVRRLPARASGEHREQSMKPVNLLIIEDDLVDRMALERFFAGGGYACDFRMARSVEEARRIIASEAFDAVVSDYLLGDGTVFDILDLNLDIPLIITTGAGSEQVAVRAMKAGAYDYLIKDQDHSYLDVLPVLIERIIRQRSAEDRVTILRDRESEESHIIGSSKALTDVLGLVDLAASSSSPVLVTGETGTGKNLVARAIHYRSALRNEPFVSINCLTIPESLIEAEMFGYEKGAFTGAASAKKGLFEMAGGGTLFLDEIGEMPYHLQGKLLSVIEDRQFRRLGGELMRSVHSRIIASTNIDIEQAVGRTFRRDLYYRIGVLRIHIPPLRERTQDIPELCSHFLRTLGRGEDQLAGGEIDLIKDYPWPGNVRELRNVLERAVIVQRGRKLRPSEFLMKEAGENRTDGGWCVPALSEKCMTLEELEQQYIEAAIEHFRGNRARTAQALGVSLSTLMRRLRAYRSS
ncbi:MAG TPA: sigma-54 dependent transcriptional regulator [Dissulfurispiraceae bacterium]|nr:sigma-54 dependent transcriptional regulator [Dissulfurispiraceae bacterium]